MSEKQLETRDSKPTHEPLAEVFDEVAALARVDGDGELLAEMATLFLKDFPSQIAAIRRALASGDAKAVMHHAHTLKGSVGNFAAKETFEAARKLEMMAREGDLTYAQATCRNLEEALERLKPVLASLVG